MCSRALRVAVCMLLVAGGLAMGSGRIEATPMQAPNSRVTMDLPDGYAPARTFSGFQHEALGVTLLIQEMPPSVYDELVKGFTPQRLLERGIRDVHTGRLARADEHVYLKGRQGTPTGEFVKLILILRAPAATVLLTANVPRPALERGMLRLEEVETALASATVGDTINRQELYQLGYTGPFKLAGNLLGTAALYTRDGRLEPEVRGRARSAFIIAPSLDSSPPQELAPFSEQLLRTLAGFRDVRLGPVEVVNIAGLEGVQISAEAVHTSDAAPMRLLQLVLVSPGGGYYRLVGMARLEEAAKLMPEFQRMIDSFRLIEAR